jgi:excisionase family DNA binding protein
MNDEAEMLLRPVEAAKRLRMSVKTLRKHVRDGSIRFVEIGRGAVRRRMAFTTTQLDDFIKRRSGLNLPMRERRGRTPKWMATRNFRA